MSQKKNVASANLNREPEYTAELFRPLPANANDAERISRPIVTYWQDAIIRLRRNRIAMASLGVIVFVCLVGIIGPFFFPDVGENLSYENVQNPDFRNQNPTLGEELLVIDDSWYPPEDRVAETFNTEAPLLTPDNLTPPGKFEFSGKPLVSGVTLTWTPVEGASGYQIFRTEIVGERAAAATTAVDTTAEVVPGTAGEDTDELVVDTPAENAVTEDSLEALRTDPALRGLQIMRIDNPAQISYTDVMGLDPSEKYAYSIVSFVTDPESGEETISREASLLSTSLGKTISLTDAQSLNPDAKVGETIRGRTFLFGTDALGRDVFARTVQGTRIDLLLAFIVPLMAILIGLIYGSVSGLVGGKVDEIMMRILEILYAMPELLLLILIQVAMGKGILSLIVALNATAWLSFARIIRGEVLKLREIEFVQASRLLGASVPSLVFRHIAPNLLGLIIVVGSARIPGVIISEAFLSLIGLGLEAPAASWGTVLQEAGLRFQDNPLQFFLPASVMGVTLLAFFLLGDALRDAFDPKLRGRE